MLELLTGTLFVTIRNSFVINLNDIREAINNESSEQDRVRHLILLD